MCLTHLKAQKDTFFLSNRTIHVGKIYKDYGDFLDLDCDDGPLLIKKNKLYKIVSAAGVVTKYKDLTYLETGLELNKYRKILKPLSAKPGLFHQNLFYGDIRISNSNFFDALFLIKDSLIRKSIKNYKRKNIISHILVPTGWMMQFTGLFAIFAFAPDIHFKNGGIYYYYENSSKIIYAGSFAILAGLTEVTLGYLQVGIASKIKKRKLIARYNSLILHD